MRLPVHFKISSPFAILISFFISGCYTVIWTPEDEFPTESNYEYDTGYYIDDYYYYYDYPWWLTITPPGNVKYEGYERDRNNNISKTRNSGDGRRTEDKGREILVTPPPTVSDDSNKTDNTNTEVRKSNSGTTSNNSSRQGSGTTSNNVRNSNGSRNNGRGR